jgi:hypothetical protein
VRSLFFRGGGVSSSWVSRWSIAPRCGSFRSNNWRLGALFTGTLSFILVKLVTTKYCFQVTNIVYKSSLVFIFLFIQNSVNERVAESY